MKAESAPSKSSLFDRATERAKQFGLGTLEAGLGVLAVEVAGEAGTFLGTLGVFGAGIFLMVGGARRALNLDSKTR